MAENKSNPAPTPHLPGAPPAPTPTVVEYFGGATGDDLLARLTDGVLDLQNPACKRFHDWEALTADCREAIRRHGKVPLTDRRVLAAIMDEATRLSARRANDSLYAKNQYPKPWLKVMSDLRRGGPLLRNTEPPEPWQSRDANYISACEYVEEGIPGVFLMGAVLDPDPL